MKRSFLLLLVFASMGVMAQTISLKKGEKVTKTLVLKINQEALNTDAFITWKMTGDWGKLDCQFSQGVVKKGFYTLNAKDYQSMTSAGKGVVLTIQGKTKTKTGDYNLNLTLDKISEGLVIKADNLNLQLNVNYEGQVPFPWVWVITAVIFAIIIVLVLNSKSKFPSGLIQFGNLEADLKGKKKVSARDVLGTEMLPEGVDVVFSKKLFGSYDGPIVKKMLGCELKRADGSIISEGEVIYEGDALYGLKDINGAEMVIRCS